MKKIFFYLSALLMVFMLAGCTELFTFNLFQFLDPVIIPSPEDLENMEEEEGVSAVLDYLEEEISSPGFIDQLNDDETGEAFNAIEEYLLGIKDDPAYDLEDRQKASVLIADLYLGTSGGTDFINSSISALSSVADSLMDENVDMAVVFDTALDNILIPEDAAEDLGSFTAFLDDLEAANSQYVDLAGTMTLQNPGTEDAYVAPEEIPDDVNMGDVLNKALITQFIVAAGGVLTDEELYKIMVTEEMDLTDIDLLRFENIENPLDDPVIEKLMVASGLDLGFGF